jgi:hypothetical protein
MEVLLCRGRGHGRTSTGCPRPGPWRDALSHHRRFSVWYYLRVFELSVSSAAAADDDDTTTTKPPTPPTTYRSLTCDTHRGRRRVVANRMRLHWQGNKDHGEKLGLSANGRKNNIRRGGGVPKCSEINKQVHAIFCTRPTTCEFWANMRTCPHVKNAMRADLSRQMKKTTDQHACIPHIDKSGTR